MKLSLTLAAEIRALRARRGLKKYQLCELAHVNDRTLARIESGRNCDSDALFRVIDALGGESIFLIKQSQQINLAHKMAKKFSVSVTTVDQACKRSVTMSQLEVLWLTCTWYTHTKHRKYFDMLMAFNQGSEYSKGITVKRLPLSYLPKFSMNKQ